MRLVATYHDLERAQHLSAYLSSQHIENHLDTELNHDWGNENYGTVCCHLWVIDEDQVEAAQKIIETFQDRPLPTVEKKVVQPEIPTPISPFPPPIAQPLGYLTFYLLVGCTLLYLMTQWTEIPINPPYPQLPLTPLFSSPTKKALMYDYPHTYELVDELADSYGIPALRSPNALPAEGQQLFLQVHGTPFWQGVYPLIVDTLEEQAETEEHLDAPLFEKQRQGEVWRLITPIFLHGDFFHLLFNMLWLLLLGRQIEARLGSWRMAILILIAAIFSNTSQYIVSGPNFIGFSGVLCAMLAFIWQRQRLAPWEGYQVQEATIKFMFVFVGGMAVLQFFSFLAEIGTGTVISPGIANTSHLSGLFIGYLLSRWSYMAIE